ncbi:VanW family protein [Actinomyces oricola]
MSRRKPADVERSVPAGGRLRAVQAASTRARPAKARPGSGRRPPGSRHSGSSYRSGAPHRPNDRRRGKSGSKAASGRTPAAARSPRRTGRSSSGPLARVWRRATQRLRAHPLLCPLLLSILGALLITWLGVAWATTQSIAPGSAISSVDVSGMSPSQARQAVQDSINDPVTVTVSGGSVQIVPAESGVSVDAAASVQRLTGFTLNPLTLIDRLGGAQVDAVATVDSQVLTDALNAHLDVLASDTVNASVTLEGTTPVTTPASAGKGADVPASVTALADWPLGQKSVPLVEGDAEPAVSDAEVATLIETTLTPMLSSNLVVTPASAKSANGSLVLTPEQTAGLLVITNEQGRLSVSLDTEGLYNAVVAAMGAGIEWTTTEGAWTIDGTPARAQEAKPEYLPAGTVLRIDTQTLAADLLTAGTTGTTATQRTVPLPMSVTPPPDAPAPPDAGLTEIVGEYSTPFESEAARDQNLIRGTEMINGSLIAPGQVFSTVDALGTVDAAHGYADAGVIVNGAHVDAMGGGLSQVGTTVFNAGFEAGMDDTEHWPHGYWLDRYPAGREATIWTGAKDVKFTNSTPYTALLQAWVGDGQVHVRLWSTPYYEVTITSGEKTNIQPTAPVQGPAEGCEPYKGGNDGFDIVVTRKRSVNGQALPDDVLNTTYAADNPVLCGGETGTAAPAAEPPP